MSSSNKKIFSHSFPGFIWKIELDEKENILVLEIRNPEKHEVSFASIALATPKIVWQDVQAAEKWWSGLETAREGLVIVHGYREPDNPEHAGIDVFSSLTGKILWKDDKKSFRALTKEGMIIAGTEKEENQYFLADPVKGTQSRELSETEMLKKLSSIVRDRQKTKIVNALHFPEGLEYFAKVAEYIVSKTGKNPAGALDYLEIAQFIVISYYIYNDKKYSNFLLLVDEDGNEFYHEPIGKDLDGIGSDTFFVFGNQLIFVKNKSDLIIYEL